MTILNLGSGKKKMSGAVSIDICSSTSPDIVHDLNQTPWPLQSDYFNTIYCSDILEHLDDLVCAMTEIHRVGKNGAKVFITTPHFSCSNSYTDPTHKHHLGIRSFDYFTDEHSLNYYSKVIFKKVQSRIIFYPRIKNYLIQKCANKWPSLYEEHLTWIFPAWFMYFELEIIKK